VSNAQPPSTPSRDHAVFTPIDTRQGYLDAVAAIAAGNGPIAIDAERASGFRYSQRAYLIQIFRRGAGTFLFDPPAVGAFDELNAVIDDTEWVLHAASQDLACLREVGLQPKKIFDTELGARLAGLPRVGLGTVVESLLGIHLAKEHSAADWSTRPLPSSWLIYAALDVELLVDLRDAIAALLLTAGCDVNLRNKAGQTALMMAALFNRSKQIEMLLDAGADPAIADASGRTAASVAQAQGNEAAVERLSNRPAISAK